MSLPFLLIALGVTALGTPIVQDGFSFQPPEGFRTDRSGMFHGSEVGAITPEPFDTPRRLALVLRDGEGPDAAVLLVSLIEAPLRATPTTRDALVQNVVQHFAELELDIGIQRAALLSDRLEVFATLKEEGTIRSVLVSAVPGEGRHLIFTLSAPPSRFETLLTPLRASLATVRLASPPTSRFSRRVLGAFAGALAGALIVSLGVWRRRSNKGL